MTHSLYLRKFPPGLRHGGRGVVQDELHAQDTDQPAQHHMSLHLQTIAINFIYGPGLACGSIMISASISAYFILLGLFVRLAMESFNGRIKRRVKMSPVEGFQQTIAFDLLNDMLFKLCKY
jgi:hypothetical protein